MTMHRCGIILTLFLASLSAAAPLYPNAAPYAGGNIGTCHLEPMKSCPVSIAEENLVINLYRGFAEVKVSYVMRNEGEDIKLNAGFPSFMAEYHDWIHGGDSVKTEITDYSITLDGAGLPATLHAGNKEVTWIKLPYGIGKDDSLNPGHPWLGWYLSPLEFKKGETRNIVITYTSRYLHSGYMASCGDNSEADLFRYLLSTGAAWKGPIGKGTITINAKEVDPDRLKIYPDKRFLRQGKSFTWQFTDLEPTGKDNITIDLNNKWQTEYLSQNKDFTWAVLHQYGKYYLRLKPLSVKASSSLVEKNFNHSADTLFDRDEKTAWVEGKKGDGAGEYIFITLEEPTVLAKLGIMNGMNYSKSLYYKNGRAAEIELALNGDFTKKVVLGDHYTTHAGWSPNAFEYVDLGEYKKAVKTIKLTITEAQKGTDFEDTCISELLLLKPLAKRPEIHCR